MKFTGVSTVDKFPHAKLYNTSVTQGFLKRDENASLTIDGWKTGSGELITYSLKVSLVY